MVNFGKFIVLRQLLGLMKYKKNNWLFVRSFFKDTSNYWTYNNMLQPDDLYENSCLAMFEQDSWLIFEYKQFNDWYVIWHVASKKQIQCIVQPSSEPNFTNSVRLYKCLQIHIILEVYISCNRFSIKIIFIFQITESINDEAPFSFSI